jgi:hypothetical protein
MVIILHQYPFKNSGACTSDWIGRVKGGVIYEYDLGALFQGGIEFTDKAENENMINKTVQKYKASFKGPGRNC